MIMKADAREDIEVAYSGDICALIGVKDVVTGDTLADRDLDIRLEPPSFPEPVISMSIEPATKADQEKMGIGLQRLAEEDPTFQVKTDEDSGQTIISGMGELHLDIIIDRLKREFDVECNQGAPQVAYKESVTTSVDHKEVYKKQSGGRGKFADIRFELSPVDDDFEGDDLQFINEIKGGNIPKEFIPSVEKGFRMAMANGVLAGYPVSSLKVRLYDGSYHDVDSDALSFEICSQIAFKLSLIHI